MTRLRLPRPLHLLLVTLLPLALPTAAFAQDCPGDISPLAESLSSIPAPSHRDGGFRTPEVPADVQRDSLAAVLSRVRANTQARVQDPSKPRGVVVVDLDYTALLHTYRSEEALRRVGTAWGIPELENPATLPLLPTYDTAGFQRWVDLVGLRAKYPGLDWDAFQDQVLGWSWDPDFKRTEVVTPGVIEFLRRVKYTGGRVVFLTARRQTDRNDMIWVLEQAGIENPTVIAKTGGMRTPAWKASKIPEIEAEHGEVIAVIDDMKYNRDAIREVAGTDVLDVAIAVPGFTTDVSPEELAGIPLRISTFERDRQGP